MVIGLFALVFASLFHRSGRLYYIGGAASASGA